MKTLAASHTLYLALATLGLGLMVAYIPNW